jgi:hypothetical protein
VAGSSAVAGVSSEAGQCYLQSLGMVPEPGLRALTEASRDLLRRSAELPDSEQGLLVVLAEYRYAVYALVAIADGLSA